jgi:hypothetical protein
MFKYTAQFMLFVALWVSCPSAKSAELVEKPQLQAAFLYHFAKFVDWPPSSFPETNSPFIVGVLGGGSFGSDPFNGYLKNNVEGQFLNGHRFSVVSFANVKDAQVLNCHILFIGTSETKRLDEIFRTLRGRSILTVSEIENFAQNGGMIQFTTQKTSTDIRIRFEINKDAVRIANMRMSSQLLSLATDIWPHAK